MCVINHWKWMNAQAVLAKNKKGKKIKENGLRRGVKDAKKTYI